MIAHPWAETPVCDSVLLWSFPKCGRTWLRYLFLHQYDQHLAAEHQPIFRRPWGTILEGVCERTDDLHLRESTIYEQLDSCDVAAVVGCEKHGGFSSLIGRSEPSERNALGDHLSAFLAYL